MTDTTSQNAQAGSLMLKLCTIKTKSYKFPADCGTLYVPENRDRSNPRLISLPVTRIRKQNAAATGAPIFWLSGGSGQANMSYRPPAELLTNHDFVMVGFRGVDGDTVLDCPEVRKALNGVGGDLLSAASLAQVNAAIAASAKRLQKQGFDLEGYTPLEVIGDMEAASKRAKAKGYRFGASMWATPF